MTRQMTPAQLRYIADIGEAVRRLKDCTTMKAVVSIGECHVGAPDAPEKCVGTINSYGEFLPNAIYTKDKGDKPV